MHYLDLSLVQNPGDFYQQVLDKLNEEGNTARNLQRAITDHKVVLLLDEFEKTAGNPDFPSDFFDALRGLAQTGELTLVTATKTPLVNLVASGAIGTSPCHNIFTQLDLGPLDDDEAHDLLIGTAALTDVSFEADILDFAVELAAGHPFELQLLGRLLFEAQQVGEVNLDRIEDKFYALLEPGSACTSRPGPISPNRSLLTLAGLFLVVAGATGVFAALSGNLILSTVTIGLMLAGVVVGGLVLALDEFEMVESKLAAGLFPNDLLYQFRDVMIRLPHIVLVFAGCHTLEQMTRRYWSPFFGVARNHKVGYLRREAAETLITNPWDDFDLNYDRQAVTQIMAATGCQPWLLQETMPCNYSARQRTAATHRSADPAHRLRG